MNKKPISGSMTLIIEWFSGSITGWVAKSIAAKLVCCAFLISDMQCLFRVLSLGMMFILYYSDIV